MLCRKDYLAVISLLALLVLFYPALFLVQSAPLIGDSLEQHYPWAFQLSQSLKNFKLPFWTSLIQCGFPLVAESQIGAFYLPNLFLYGLLPFQLAYSYMNLLHWFISGWGIYIYSRQLKLESLPSFIAALIFVFGAAYGGAYYNMTSLKTICWFPVGLYFFERYLEKQKWYFLLIIAFVMSQSLMAGYLQVSVLTWLMFLAYAFLRIIFFSDSFAEWSRKTLSLGAIILGAGFGILLAFPQIYLTFEQAILSNRAGLEEGYAYLGSMSPLVLITLIFPKVSLILRSNNLYSGFFALFLVLFAIFSPETRKNNLFKIWAAMTVLALLLSLGRWSPLYVALIKLTKFYSFRFPLKFIGFASFGIAMLSAIGFQALWQERNGEIHAKKAYSAYLTVVGFFIGIMFFGNLLLTAGRNMAFKMGEFYVSHFIYNKPGHSHTLETYLERVRGFPDHALRFISLSDPANLWAIAMFCFPAIFLSIFILKKIAIKSFLYASIGLLVVDLYIASHFDIQLDLAPYDQASKSQTVVNILQAEKLNQNLGRIYSFYTEGKRTPLIPSENMIYGFKDIGVYSPLVSRRYFESVGLLGNVNDSNYQIFPPLEFVLERLPLLNFLNVSHIISSEPIQHAELKLIGQVDGSKIFVYRNTKPREPAYFISRVHTAENWNELREKLMAPFFNPKEILLLEKEELEKMKDFNSENLSDSRASMRLEKQSEGFEQWQIETKRAGFLVIPETFFPGWTATVNNVPVPILKAFGLFRAVWINGLGRYQVEFQYKPFSGLFPQKDH